MHTSRLILMTIVCMVFLCSGIVTADEKASTGDAEKSASATKGMMQDPEVLWQRFLDALIAEDAKAAQTCWADAAMAMKVMRVMPEGSKRRIPDAAIADSFKMREAFFPELFTKLIRAMKDKEIDLQSLKLTGYSAIIVSQDDGKLLDNPKLRAADKNGKQIVINIEKGWLVNGKWLFTTSLKNRFFLNGELVEFEVKRL